jgi:hypothetical protein
MRSNADKPLGALCPEKNLGDVQMPVRKILLAIVALIALLELFLIFRPEPAILTAGIALGEAPVTNMLRQRFPIGSPASALEEELKQEGYWGPVHIDRASQTRVFHYVQFRRWTGLFSPLLTTVLWEVDDDGRLTALSGSKFIDITMP